MTCGWGRGTAGSPGIPSPPGAAIPFPSRLTPVQSRSPTGGSGSERLRVSPGTARARPAGATRRIRAADHPYNVRVVRLAAGKAVRRNPRRRTPPPGRVGLGGGDRREPAGKVHYMYRGGLGTRAASYRHAEHRAGDPRTELRADEHALGIVAVVYLGEHHHDPSGTRRDDLDRHVRRGPVVLGAGGGQRPAAHAEPGRRSTDDWILSSCETDRALYFGSFGGGVSVRSKADGSWRRIGIHDGLSSLDVPAIAWRPPSLFFGTLGGGVSVYDEAADGAHP